MLLEARNVSKVFVVKKHSQRVQALSHIHLSIDDAQTIALVGESGSGKTTLARILIKLIEPTSGEVLFEGERIHQKNLISFRRSVRMVFQDPFSSLDPRFTIEQSLKEALILEKGLSKQQQKQRMTQCLGDVGLSVDILDRFPHAFSGGERQRICIARALMTDPSLLILDEPVSSVDVLVQDQILTVLQQLQQHKKIAILLITHHLGVAKRLCEKIVIMKQGSIVECGYIKDIFQQPKHIYTQHLLKAVQY